jgi:hypothetical protein
MAIMKYLWIKNLSFSVPKLNVFKCEINNAPYAKSNIPVEQQ